MATSTRTRLSRNTATEFSRTINQSIESSIRYHLKHKNEISHRLQELDEEWDIERTIQANAAGASLIGLTFGLLGRSRWFLVPAMVSGFMLQHAIEGWCPPFPILRRLGYRTSFEIEQERQALKLIRGDYKSVTDGDSDAEDVLKSVQA